MATEPPVIAIPQDRVRQAREQIDAALEALVGDVLAQAAADTAALIEKARTESESALNQRIAAAEAQAAMAAAAAVEKLRVESEAALAERVAAAQSQAEAAKASTDSSLRERLTAMEALMAHAAAEAAQKTAQLTAERAETEKRLAEAEAHLARAAEAEQRNAQLIAERDEAGKRLTDAQAQAAVQAEAAAGTRAEERECDLACLERLVDAVRELDAAASLSQVLDKLADHAAAHVARVAVFVAREGELHGWRLQGFGDVQASATIVPLDQPTVLRRAFETGGRATTANGTADSHVDAPAFAALPVDRVGLALPLTVGNRTVAVLYGDEGPAGDRTVPSAWPEVLELLARHAACRLELLTLARAQGLHAQQHENNRPVSTAGEAAATPHISPRHTPPPGGRPPSMATDSSVKAGRAEDLRRTAEEDASAQRYARLLISEIKLYHEDAVNEGRRDANLLARLGPEITRARRLYEERIPAEVRSRADHFGTELVRTLANGDPRLLGQTT